MYFGEWAEFWDAEERRNCKTLTKGGLWDAEKRRKL
jgi:hypothetical protein